MDRTILGRKFKSRVALAKLCEITPLEAAKVWFIPTRFVLFEQLNRAPEVSVFHGLMREVDVSDVLIHPCRRFLALSLLAQPAFLALQGKGSIFCTGGANCLPQAQSG